MAQSSSSFGVSWQEKEGLNKGQMALLSTHTLWVGLVITSLWADASAITMVELQASLLTLALLQAWASSLSLPEPVLRRP